jgi:steroid 5-alpha reductase family enzyme
MNYFLILGFVLFVYMNLCFLISLLKKRNDIADMAWGLGFVLLTWVSFFIGVENSPRALLVGFLVSIWGLRLACHIYSRNKNKSEDYRYKAWREAWGAWFYLRSYFQVYLLQGFLLFVIALPVLLLNQKSAQPLNWLDLVGFGLWIVGFYFEAMGDYQLSRFIQNPENKGNLMQSGLWAYTRHPNYFGEVLQWWAIWLISLSVSGAWIGLIGPLTITFLILKVSGIPILEAKMQKHPQFSSYKKRVSIFLPLPPRKE